MGGSLFGGLGGGSGDASVDVRITITHKDASKGLDDIGKNAAKSAKDVSFFTRVINSLQSQISTFVKAIVSMVGVLLVWNTTIVPIEFALGKLRDGIVAATIAMADFEVQIISIQAILASTIKFSDDFGESFKQAGNIARAVFAQLVSRSSEIVGSIDDALVAFQAIAAEGGSELARNLQQVVDMSILFANSVRVVNPTIESQRAVFSEIAAVIRGQERSMDRVSKLLGVSSAEMQKLRAESKGTGVYFDEIANRLHAIQEASEDFGMTLRGIWTSITDFVEKNLVIVAFGPFYEELKTFMINLRNALITHYNELVAAIVPITASLIILLSTIANAFGPSGDVVKGIQITGHIIGFIITYIAAEVERLIDLVKALLSLDFRSLFSIGGGLRGGLTDAQSRALMGGNVLGPDWTTLTDKVRRYILAMQDAGDQQEKFEQQVLAGSEALLKKLVTYARGANPMLEALRKIREEATKTAESLIRSLESQIVGMERQLLTPLERMRYDFSKNIEQIKEFIDIVPGLAIEAVRKSFQVFQLELHVHMKQMEDELNKFVEKASLRLRKSFPLIDTPKFEIQELDARIEDYLASIRKQAAAVRGELDAFGPAMDMGLVPALERSLQQMQGMLRLTMRNTDAYFRLRREVSVVEGLLTRIRMIPMSSAIEDSYAAMRRFNREILLGGQVIESGILERMRKIQATLKDMLALVQDPTLVDLLLAQIEGIEVAFNRVFDKIVNTADVAAQNIAKVFRDALLGDTVSFFSTLAASIEYIFGNMVISVGEAFGRLFTDIFTRSEDVLKSFAAFIGTTLIRLGEWAVATGAIMIAASFIKLLQPVVGTPKQGAALMAAGIAAIAAGAAMGGGGGRGRGSSRPSSAGSSEIPEFAFNQSLINVQQSLNASIGGLNEATYNLNSTVNKLSSMRPGALVKMGVREDTGVLNSLSQAANRNMTAGRGLAAATSGGGSTGGF